MAIFWNGIISMAELNAMIKEGIIKENLIQTLEIKLSHRNLEEQHRTKQLMKTEVQRLISWFDNETDSLIGEYNIEMLISLAELKTIFDPYPDDPLMYMVYDVSPEIGISLNKYFSFDFDFEKYSYQLDCFWVMNKTCGEAKKR